MAKKELNLGSTFNEFLNALNTNTEDTEGIIEGTKKVKKLSLGEEDDEKGSLEYNIENNVTNVLLKGQSATLQSNPHEQGWGSKIVCDKGLINLFADSDITIRADKGAFTRFCNDITFNEANIVGKVDFSNATVTGLPSSGGGSLDLDADYDWNGDHTFNKDITLKGSLIFANNGQINDSEEQLQIYKGIGSMWIGTEEGGYIDINSDEMRFESYTSSMFVSNQNLTFAAMNGISIVSGESDDTYFELTPTSFDVYANKGNINFSSRNDITFVIENDDGSTTFSIDNSGVNISTPDGSNVYIGDAFESDVQANFYNGITTNSIHSGASLSITSDENITLERGGRNGVYLNSDNISIYDENADTGNCAGIELNDGTVNISADVSTNFNGNVDFSNATVIGLPSGGLDIPEEVINYDSENNYLSFSSDSVGLFALNENSSIEMTVGGDDETTAYFSTSQMRFSSVGVVNFTGNEGITFTAGQNSNTKFNGNVDFTNANVIGLPSGGSGGTLAIEVEELPTENIDNSKIYVLNEIKNAEVYYHDEISYYTLKSLITSQLSVNPEIIYYVVKELPTSPLTSDLATFSSINCYIYNDIAYVYGNAGYGDMWLPVSALVSQISGITVIDKGKTPNIATENNDIAMYVYYEDYKKFYLYSNEQWVQITDSKSNTYILSLSGTSGTLTDEQYQAIKDNFPNVIVLYTAQDSNDTVTAVIPIIGVVNGAYVATYTTNQAVSDITIYADKSWDFQEYNFKNVYVTMNSPQIIDGDKTFTGTVDFSSAIVTGLPSNGGSGGGSSPLAIQVNELPTENIDNSKVYIVAENPQVYLRVYTTLLTLENMLEGSGVTNPVVNYHVVPTLPTEGEVTDFVTMTPMHCYINSSNGIAYFYGNLGAGNMWVNASALAGQVLETEAKDAGRTYNISNEPTELFLCIYTYWEDVQYVYTINNQWCKVNYSIGFDTDDDYFFTGRNIFAGSTHLKNNVTIGDSDAGNIGIVQFFTEQVTFNHGKVTFNNGHEADIYGKVEFNGKVDFTNATVIGLSGSGLTQEEVQEMINTAINGALEGDY